MTGPTVRTEWRERVLVATIDRPTRRNAVDHETLLSLRAAQVAAVEGDARAFVLTGAPPAFCAGADLTGVESGEFTRVLLDVLQSFGRLPFACIAAVDGPALGAGTQLAIACDLRVATPSSRFGIPAAKLGLVVDHWTVERLAREVGWSIARNMLLTATAYDASALVAPGFVHRLGGLDEALGWAEEIALLAPLTIAGHKLGLEQSGAVPAHDDLVAEARERAWASADAEEGRIAFLAKRPPRFTGT
ncbi:MAG: enoyl-CoA hydratase-related protein [Acidimicrobiia bacterium]